MNVDHDSRANPVYNNDTTSASTRDHGADDDSHDPLPKNVGSNDTLDNEKNGHGRKRVSKSIPTMSLLLNLTHSLHFL